MRYVLEGEWTGYTNSQRRVVHREVIRSEKRASALKKLRIIDYTDGTLLIVRLRQLEPQEKVQPINGYTSLIRKAEATGFSRVRVADLKND